MKTDKFLKKSHDPRKQRTERGIRTSFELFLFFFLYIFKAGKVIPDIKSDLYLNGSLPNNGFHQFKLDRIVHDLPFDHLLSTTHIRDQIVRRDDYINIDETTKYLYTRLLPRRLFDTQIIHDEAVVFDAHYACIKDIFVNSYSTYSDGDVLYIPKNYTGMPFTWIYEKRDGKLVGAARSVIALGHYATYMYGHFFLDVMVPLMMIPDEIVNESMILILHKYDFVDETFKAFGWENKILNPPPDDWYFVHRLYVAYDPMPHVGHRGVALTEFSRRIKEAYGVNESVRAYRYTLMNRRWNSRRTVTNFNEFVDLVKKTYTNISWEIIEDFHTMRDTVILYNSIKFHFTPTGSNLIRIFFMQKDTVVLSAQCDFNDFVMQSIAISAKVHMFLVANNCDHDMPAPIKISIKDVARVFDKALKYALSLP